MSVAKYRKKVCCPNDGIEVDYSGEGFAVIICQWLDYPHACVVVW